ncbi:hypothetical protein ARZXY2_3576 [Arthrobacter sp. ZXY-2]|nr:hypothetical protein ARZXY2_3576 [Arthrobacter sp. ZXY-2]
MSRVLGADGHGALLNGSERICSNLGRFWVTAQKILLYRI